MKRSQLNNLILEAYAEVISELNEAPEGMFYITTSLRDVKKALAHLDDMHRGKFEVNDPNTFYFTDESEAHDALEHFGAQDIEVIDTNIGLDETLNESLLDEVEEEDPTPEEDPDPNAGPETVLEDATDTILGKFPTLRQAIIKLQTEDFKEFVDTIDWISPRPTSFRVNLKNGQDYMLKWTGKTFEAQIMGKRYLLSNIADYQQALDKLAILYRESPMKGAGEEGGGEFDADTGGGGGGGGDFPGGEGGAEGGEDLGGAEGGEAGGEEGGEDLTDEPIDFETGEEG
jgi:hypothetical protein